MADSPVIYQDNGKLKIKVIAGSFESTVSPVKTFTLINTYEVNSSENSKLEIPYVRGQQYFVFSIVRKIMDWKSTNPAKKFGDSRTGSSIKLKMEEDSKVLILNGEPIDETIVAYGVLL